MRKATILVLAGLAIGIALINLPWEVIGITLAGPTSYYVQQEKDLSCAFASSFGKCEIGLDKEGDILSSKMTMPVLHVLEPQLSVNLTLAGPIPGHLNLRWQERANPRKFGKVIAGEIEACFQVQLSSFSYLTTQRCFSLVHQPVSSLAAGSQRISDDFSDDP